MKAKIVCKKTIYIETEINVSDYIQTDSLDNQVEWLMKAKTFDPSELMEIALSEKSANQEDIKDFEIDADISLVKEQK